MPPAASRPIDHRSKCTKCPFPRSPVIMRQTAVAFSCGDTFIMPDAIARRHVKGASCLQKETAYEMVLTRLLTQYVALAIVKIPRVYRVINY